MVENETCSTNDRTHRNGGIRRHTMKRLLAAEAAAERTDPIDSADLPGGPAFEARRLRRAISAEGLADLALECFDPGVVAEVDILKPPEQRDRDLAQLGAAFKRSLTTGSGKWTRGGLRVVARARSAARSADIRDQTRWFEGLIRKLVWQVPFAALDKSREDKVSKFRRPAWSIPSNKKP
jgi:hypothetical protein